MNDSRDILISKNVLWLNSHEMSNVQKEALEQCYGKVDIINYPERITASLSDELKDLIDKSDIIAQNLPVELQQQLLKYADGKPVITAVGEKRESKLEKEAENKPFEFVFKAWEKVDSINIEKTSLEPIQGYVIGYTGEKKTTDLNDYGIDVTVNYDFITGFAATANEANELYDELSSNGIDKNDIFYREIRDNKVIEENKYKSPLENTNILWFSRHPMAEKQIEDLKGIYGPNIDITQIDKTVRSANDIEDMLKTADVVCAVAPIEIQQQIKQSIRNKPLLTAEMERSADGELSFKKWNEIKNISISKQEIVHMPQDQVKSAQNECAEKITSNLERLKQQSSFSVNRMESIKDESQKYKSTHEKQANEIAKNEDLTL